MPSGPILTLFRVESFKKYLLTLIVGDLLIGAEDNHILVLTVFGEFASISLHRVINYILTVIYRMNLEVEEDIGT